MTQRSTPYDILFGAAPAPDAFALGVLTTGAEDHTTNLESPARYQDRVIYTSHSSALSLLPTVKAPIPLLGTGTSTNGY